MAFLIYVHYTYWFKIKLLHNCNFFDSFTTVGNGIKYNEPVQQCVNHDLTSIVAPVGTKRLRRLIEQSGFDRDEGQFILQGFEQGFDIGYNGPISRHSRSKNIPFSVGNKVIMWNKLMKEVKAQRVAGPFDQIPFANFIQSPIGLVPIGSNETRLIFHLSYNFSDQEKSLNFHTPHELCTVRYNDLDHAVAMCLDLLRDVQVYEDAIHHPAYSQNLFLSKLDLKSAFRILPLNRRS